MCIPIAGRLPIVTELSRLVDQGNLMAVSELEQELACGGHNFAVHFTRMVEVIEELRTKPASRLRLALLFVLRYEKELRDDAGQKLGQLKDLLFKFGCGVPVLSHAHAMKR